MAQPLSQPAIPLLSRPTCFVWYAGDPCDELIQQYNRVVEQRHQQEWQASVTEPLQKQIADQQDQIKTLQAKIDSQTLDELQSEARTQALLDGIGAGLGAGLAFFVAVAVFRRLARNAMAAKPDQGRAASA